MATKRAAADANELQNKIYEESGIYYSVNDSNVLHGTACIFGPQGTPYEDCPMLYEFEIGNTYPFDPPKVKFATYDGKTRFHPNMYIEGKVCLSILHTWQGPKWASTMRLSTVLLSMQSIMDTSPLRHEPGYETGRDELCANYAKQVEYACIDYTLKRAECSGVQPVAFEPFVDSFKKRLPDALDRIQKRLEKRIQEGNTNNSTNLPYNMYPKTDYSQLLERVVKLKALLLVQKDK